MLQMEMRLLVAHRMLILQMTSLIFDALDNSIPLFNGEDGDTLHYSLVLVTLPLDRSRLILMWAISTLVDATKFLGGPLVCYQEESSPPLALLA